MTSLRMYFKILHLCRIELCSLCTQPRRVGEPASHHPVWPLALLQRVRLLRILRAGSDTTTRGIDWSPGGCPRAADKARTCAELPKHRADTAQTPPVRQVLVTGDRCRDLFQVFGAGSRSRSSSQVALPE